MTKICPHCQASLPSTGDAYCFECGGALDEPASAETRHFTNLVDEVETSFDPRRYTFAGRLVILIYVLLGLLGTLCLIAYNWEFLPPGSYPLFYFAAPFALLAFLLCANTFHFLEKMGVKVYADWAAPPSRNDADGKSI